ncbi:RAC-gamma serine/threonine-protein kinase [Balamuthia mandrillaris]
MAAEDPVAEELQRGLFGWLPCELIEAIMIEVSRDASALCAARLTCYAWRHFIDHPLRDRLLWRRAASFLFPPSYFKFMEPLISSSCSSTSSSSSSFPPSPSASSTYLYDSWRVFCIVEAMCPNVEEFEQLRVIDKGNNHTSKLVRWKQDQRKARRGKTNEDGYYVMKRWHFYSLDEVIAYKQAISSLSKQCCVPSQVIRVIHPWLLPSEVLELCNTHQTKYSAFSLFEHVNGGELFYRLQQDKTFGFHRTAFYLAQVWLVLEWAEQTGQPFLPSLMPEHILLDSDGYLRVDCSGGWQNLTTTRSAHCFVASPEYLPPEVLTGASGQFPPAMPHCLWMLGCLAYEMIFGLPPFYSENVATMYKAIMMNTVSWPDKSTCCKQSIPSSFRELVERLVNKDPTKRSIDDWRNHPFFKEHGFADEAAWQLLTAKAMPAPFKPLIKDGPSGMICMESFHVPPVYNEETTSTPMFEGFTYVPEQN